MSIFNPFQKVSQSPTRPVLQKPGESREIDVAELYQGPITAGTVPNTAAIPLDEKLRQAYFWIVNHAILSPFYDIEYQRGPSARYPMGDRKSQVVLPSGQSYSSFVLLPILTFATRRKCLFIGGPGRGKTASAILMGILAGLSVKEVKRAIQKGQPQMTISDLLGNPLPADLVSAQKLGDIRIAWRKWLGMPVKIIDEYNRIPTRTQSALLTVMADGYAEILDQVFECPEAAWFLTANDDSGGGTYQVIEALRDRIDVVVKALHFNTRFVGQLLTRIENKISPEDFVPQSIIFTKEEWDRMYDEILAVKLPQPLRRRLEFFASHLEFFDSASTQIEYKTKDTVKLSGVDLNSIQESGKDAVRDLGSQTKNGLSVRALLTSLYFLKGMAYFRGGDQVEIEDLRQILPFVLHDKLTQNPDSPFFDTPETEIYRIDKICWIRRLFDLSCAEYDRLDLDRQDPLRDYLESFEKGLEGLSEREVQKRLAEIEKTLSGWSDGRKLYGHVFDDVLTLKYLHQRYTNYLAWLQWQAK